MLGRSLGSLVVRVFGAALSLGSGVVLGRVLGTDGFGQYAYATAWWTLLFVPAGLRGNVLMVRWAAAHEVSGAWGPFRWLAGQLARRVLGASIVVTLLALAVMHAALQLGHAPDALEPSTFTWILASLPLVAVGQLAQGVVEARRWTVRSQLPELLFRQALPLAITASLALSGMTVTSSHAALFLLGGCAVFLLAHAGMARSASPPAMWSTPPEPAEAELQGRLTPLVMTGFLTAITQQTGALVLGELSDASSVGTYVAASRFASVLVFVPTSINVAYGTSAAALWARGDRGQLARLGRRAAMVSTGINGLLAVALIVFAGPLLSVLGEGFVGGADALAVLALGQLVSSAGGPNGITLLMTGHEREAAIGMGVSAGATLALTLALVPWWGAVGAAVGGALGIVAWNVCLGVLIRRRLGIGVSVLDALWSRGP